MRNGLNKGFVGFKDSFFRLRLLNVSNKCYFIFKKYKKVNEKAKQTIKLKQHNF